jgi:hypothetical protein
MPELSIPKLQPTEFERAAIENLKLPTVTAADLERLAAIGKQPQPSAVTPVADAELSSAIAHADAALRATGFVEGRTRMHRNRA